MESKIAKATGLKYPSVAIILSDEKPSKCRQFKEGKWGCVMFLLAAVLKGETAAFDSKTFGCFGGGVGLGFGNQYQNFPGGEECFKYFLSSGNEQWEDGQTAGAQVKPYMRPEAFHHFMHGERYLKSPEMTDRFIKSLPITEVPTKYVIFKPLSDVDRSNEHPQTIVFFGDMDQISALTVLVNFGRGHNENVIFPWAAGCQTLGIYPYAEAQKAEPRAVLGLNDISARVYLKRILKDDLMSFAVPLSLYREMEDNVEESFLMQASWQELVKLKSRPQDSNDSKHADD